MNLCILFHYLYLYSKYIKSYLVIYEYLSLIINFCDDSLNKWSNLSIAELFDQELPQSKFKKYKYKETFQILFRLSLYRLKLSFLEYMFTGISIFD